jgi:ZIP family zinc transporter
MITGVAAGTWLVVLGLASLSVVSTFAGVALARRTGGRAGPRAVGLGVSVGIMLAIAFGELLPEAYREVGFVTMALGALAGAGLIGVLHLVIPHTHLVDEDTGVGAGTLSTASLVVFGLILHDLPEGFAMANAYLSAPRLGVLVAVAIVVHNVPEEYAMALPAVMTGRTRFLFWAAVASASAEPAGAVIGLVGISVFPGMRATFLAFAAGAMAHVAIHELLPMAHRLGRHRETVLGIVAGIVVLGLFAWIIVP